MIETPFSKPIGRFHLALLLAMCAWVLGALLAWPRGLIGDEWVHFPQVSGFRAGDTRVLGLLTTIPGYHWLIALALRLLDAESLGAARLVNMMLGLGAVGFFYLLRRQLHPGDALRAAAQFSVLPVLFPFFFLVYTDVASLMLVLAAIYATLRSRHGWAALIMFGAMVVRQNNVVWIALLALWALAPVWRAGGWRPWRCWRESIQVAWPYALPLIAFFAYWWWRGTISFSVQQSSMHPDGTLHVGNPVFALVLVACLLPLQTLAGLRMFVLRARVNPWLWLVPVVAIVVFFNFFAVDHPYNFIAMKVNVRNMWLKSVALDTGAWATFGLLATAGACGMAGNGLVRAEGWWFAPVAFVGLAASWLIEPRYSLIPLAIYLCLRKPGVAVVETTTLALWAGLAVCTVIAIFAFGFMI